MNFLHYLYLYYVSFLILTGRTMHTHTFTGARRIRQQLRRYLKRFHIEIASSKDVSNILRCVVWYVIGYILIDFLLHATYMHNTHTHTHTRTHKHTHTKHAYMQRLLLKCRSVTAKWHI